MKREIRFRAWDKLNEQMIYPLPTSRNTSGDLLNRWDDENLMQFTGLNDKNGKEIYEGDIIKTETEKAMQVSWNVHFASFCLDRDGWMFTHYFGEAVDPEQVEVIGNIFENPELIKP